MAYTRNELLLLKILSDFCTPSILNYFTLNLHLHFCFFSFFCSIVFFWFRKSS